MNRKLPLISAIAAMTPSMAFAHPGLFHVHTFAAGLQHPLSGMDHFLAMISVGLWAAQKGGRALWLWPCSFVAVMLAGGILGVEGIALPLIEPIIAVSLLVLGLMVASAAQLPLWAGSAIIAGFALFHGNAHGLEAPADGSGLAYAIGFVISTLLLHVTGLVLGLYALRAHNEKWIRAGAAATAVVGAAFLFL